MIQDAGCNVACEYVQVDESTLPVIDNEKRRAVKGYVWSVVNVMTGDRFFFYEHGSRSARVAMGLLKDFTGAIQSDGYIVYEHFEGMEGKKLLGCWAHARRKNYLFCGDDDAAQRAPWSTPCLPPARHTALMNGRGLRMSCAGSRNTNRQGKTTQTFFPQTGAPCPQSNSSQYHTPIKRLQPASH